MFNLRTVAATTLVAANLLMAVANASVIWKPNSNTWIEQNGGVLTVCYLVPPKGVKTEFKLDNWFCHLEYVAKLTPKKKKKYGIS